jgi:hypothetical protein
MADAKFLELACWTGYIYAKSVILQHATRYVSKPSKLECFPAENASTKKLRMAPQWGSCIPVQGICFLWCLQGCSQDRQHTIV